MSEQVRGFYKAKASSLGPRAESGCWFDMRHALQGSSSTANSVKSYAGAVARLSLGFEKPPSPLPFALRAALAAKCKQVADLAQRAGRMRDVGSLLGVPPPGPRWWSLQGNCPPPLPVGCRWRAELSSTSAAQAGARSSARPARQPLSSRALV